MPAARCAHHPGGWLFGQGPGPAIVVSLCGAMKQLALVFAAPRRRGRCAAVGAARARPRASPRAPRRRRRSAGARRGGDRPRRRRLPLRRPPRRHPGTSSSSPAPRSVPRSHAGSPPRGRRARYTTRRARCRRASAGDLGHEVDLEHAPAALKDALKEAIPYLSYCYRNADISRDRTAAVQLTLDGDPDVGTLVRSGRLRRPRRQPARSRARGLPAHDARVARVATARRG